MVDNSIETTLFDIVHLHNGFQGFKANYCLSVKDLSDEQKIDLACFLNKIATAIAENKRLPKVHKCI